MIYPLAYLALTSALTVVLLIVGLAGQAALAAELAVIQGALLATFYSFSANTRSLILQGHGELTPDRLLAKRVIALPLLGIASYVLCVVAVGVSAQLALLLILRRSCEWLAEVRLCEMEVANERRSAARAFFVQAAITLAAGALLVFLPGAALPALAVFAVSPLFSSAPRLKLAAFRLAALGATLRGATPHIGSTAIEGISAYVLRLIVFLIAGREMSGLLFTAFVLGSFAATLFANVLGPSLALRRAREGDGRRRDFGVIAGAGAMAGSGLLLSAVVLALHLPGWLGKPGYFWLALGLSLLGGGVMIAAQLIRLKLFDERRAEVLFGPDVLRHLTAILVAPALYYLAGPPALGALYLATALITLFFYWGAGSREMTDLSAGRSAALRVAIAIALLFPLFFQLAGGVYHKPGDPLFDPGGSVMQVPLPLSLAACFAGLLLLARYRHAALALGTIFFLFVAMVLTSVVATHGDIAYESRKFLLLFQFLVPAFGLVLGQMFGEPRRGLHLAARGFLIVLAVLLPLQVARSIGYHENELRHDYWIFSIYQHVQYVPAVILCAYLIALFALWDSRRERVVLLILAPVLACYVAASYSLLPIALAVGGALLLLLARWREPAARWCAALVIVVLAGYLTVNRNVPPLRDKFAGAQTELRLSQGPDAGVTRSMVEAVPGPMQVRLHYWTLFARGIAESGKTALFGHAQAIDRSVAPSAHNYYLDFIYNFGVLAFLPFLWLIGYTLRALWRERSALRHDLPLLGLAAAVLYALFLDSVFKVPLRQPYPGIFFFFLWGLLLAQLQARRLGESR